MLHLQDAGSEGIGFMLGSLNVQWGLTSEACYKSLSKSASGEVSSFKGLYQWFVRVVSFLQRIFFTFVIKFS